jgi:hypothetical protein
MRASIHGVCKPLTPRHASVTATRTVAWEAPADRARGLDSGPQKHSFFASSAIGHEGRTARPTITRPASSSLAGRAATSDLAPSRGRVCLAGGGDVTRVQSFSHLAGSDDAFRGHRLGSDHSLPNNQRGTSKCCHTRRRAVAGANSGQSLASRAIAVCQ